MNIFQKQKEWGPYASQWRLASAPVTVMDKRYIEENSLYLSTCTWPASMSQLYRYRNQIQIQGQCKVAIYSLKPIVTVRKC